MKKFGKYIEYVKVWYVIKRCYSAYYAHRARKKLASLHSVVVSTLESDMSKEEKEKKLNIPLRQLSNDISSQLPHLKRKIIKYRKKATDLYQERGKEEKLSEIINKIGDVWGDVDLDLSKLLYFNVGGIAVNIITIFMLGEVCLKYITR